MIENDAPNSPNLDGKAPEEGEKQPTIKDKLLSISQIARKIAYWLDDDTELPQGFNNTIDVISKKLNQMNQFVSDQMVDVSDNLDEEVKSVPTKPEMWSRIKKNTAEKYGKKELGKVGTWFATKEYKDKGGNWRKKKRKKSDESYGA